MNDGVYLLVLPGDDFGVPVTLKSQSNPDGTKFQILVSIEGVLLLQNLPPGFALIPMVVITEPRLLALSYAAGILSKINQKKETRMHLAEIDRILAELNGDDSNWEELKYD